VAKLRAEQRLPRNTTDMTHMSDFDAAQLLGQDILADIDCTRATYADPLTPSTHLATALTGRRFFPLHGRHVRPAPPESMSRSPQTTCIP